MDAPLQIIFVGHHRWRAQFVFNGNAYPTNIRSVVDACASRYALLLYHTSVMRQALQRDISDFRSMIEGQRTDLEKALRSRPDLTSVAVYDGLPHLAEMHSSLSISKSFLDLYAKLVGKLINPLNNWNFGKANVGGGEVSGGRLVNALRNSGQQSLAGLADLTLEHSRRWITEAVKYRDQLSHRSDLDHMRCMQLPLHCTDPHINFSELVMPAMPNGQDLGEYLDGLLSNLAEYVSESIIMLPNIDSTLISPKRLVTT
ncbi:MAG: hypothetical protein ABSE05_06295 [Syntrophales bacterium]|jgi:hypothetical protein